jgi:hypothetical protein
MLNISNHDFTGIPEEYFVRQNNLSSDGRDSTEELQIWLLRYTGYSLITTDSQKAKKAAREGALVTAYTPLEEFTQLSHPTMTPMARLRSCEDVLRSLAGYLSMRGYNTPYLDRQLKYS